MRHYCPGSAACCVNAVCSAIISPACIVCWCDAVSLPWLLKSRATIDSSCGSVEFSRRVHAGQKHWSCSVLWLWPRPPGEQLNFPWKVRSGLCWSQPAAHYLYPPHRRHAHLRGHGGGQRVRELLGRQEDTSWERFLIAIVNQLNKIIPLHVK